LHTDKLYSQKALHASQRHALPRAAALEPELSAAGNEHLQPASCVGALFNQRDTLLQVPADNKYSRQSSQAMLAAAITFLLVMSTNATTIWGIQGNIQVLAGVSRTLQELAGRSQDLEVSMGRHFNDQNVLMLENLEPLAGETTRDEAPMTDAIQIGKIGLNTRIEPPSASRQARPSAHAPNSGKRPAYGKFGPPLLLNAAQAARTAGMPDAYPHVKEIQSNLLALGFDLGEDQVKGITGTRTVQAMNELRLLYLPAAGKQKAPDGNQLIATVMKYANQARQDKKKFGIDSGILAAIRLGSLRTGVDFSFLMELASIESSFDPTKKASKTFAAGLYQFKDDTWLETVKTYGEKYGIGSYASQVENNIDDTGNTQPTIRDPVVYRHVLALRHNPRISALLAAEYVKYNMKRLAYSLDRKPGQTDLYLSHFFGAAGAISFLKTLDEHPDKIAGDVFPQAAKNNQSIFQPKLSKPRTVAEVYKIFERKFNTSRYRDSNPS